MELLIAPDKKPNVYICHRTIEKERAVAMVIFDQLSTYIRVYVDNYQNDIYFEKKKNVHTAN